MRASDQRAFLRRAHVFADELTELTGEPVHVTVYDHGTSVTVATASADVVRSTDTVPIAVGSRRPAHASASGKVFLGYNSAALTAYLLRPLQAFTERTIVDAGELRAECARIRARGWSTDAQENTLGVSCVAVPVWGMTDRVVGSLVVSTRQTEMSDSAREELLGLLTPAAEEFSRAVGGAQR
ncbi:MAG: IclR family transcriptional regulator [Nocardioidaceae bacterium]